MRTRRTEFRNAIFSTSMPKKIYGKTKDGVDITDELIEEYAAEAERGYDLDKLEIRRGRPLIGRATASTFAVRLDPELRSALDLRAADEGRPASEIVRQALRAYLGTAGSVSGDR